MVFDKNSAEEWYEVLQEKLPQVTINYQDKDMIALVGASVFVSYDSNTMSHVEIQSADFVVKREELTQKVKRNDIITCTDEWNVQCVYEVIEPVYRWLEPTKSLIRIHTKLINEIHPIDDDSDDTSDDDN